MKITLSNGQVLINGNPYMQLPEGAHNVDEYWDSLEKTSDNPLPYVKALTGQVITEIDNEILQGATLNVEYTISIRNNSEIDYEYKQYQDYYYYGKKSNNQGEISAAIRKVVDYMEDSLVYDDEQNSAEWKTVKSSELINWNEDGVNKKLVSDNVEKAIRQGYVIAVTEYFYTHKIEAGQIGSIKIYGNKILATSEKGIDVKNHAEIIETIGVRTIKGSTPGNYNPNEMSPHEPDDDMTSLVITPPTGLKDNKIFIISASVIAMTILAGGVYVIKKKVLE